MTPHAFGKTVARNPVKRLGVPDRVVDRRRPKGPGVGRNPLRIARRYVTVAPAKGYHPAIALKRQHDAATPVLGCLGEGPDALPLGRGIVRDGINARGIAEIDANCSLLGQRTADRPQQGESGGAASGGVHDKIGRNRLARTVAVLVAHAGIRRSSSAICMNERGRSSPGEDDFA
jgi:hypothetical protein